jgi:nicotinamidase-related amidase
MSAIIDIRTFFSAAAAPTLVLIDMQQEYLASDRMLSLGNCDDALENCRHALAHARLMGFPVAFVRWTGRSTFFNVATRYHRWIEGFEPRGSDMVFERSLPSCFSSTLFADVMTNAGGQLVLAGFSGEAACLSTAIDALHRGIEFTYLADASASHDLAGASGPDVHQMLCKIVQLYGPVMDTRAWTDGTSVERETRIARA